MTIDDAPTNIGYGRVTGRFIYDVVDGPDVDSHPDYKALAGFITFRASINKAIDAGALPVPVVIGRTIIKAVLDYEGYLCTPDENGQASYRWIELLATDDIDLNPSGWEWTVSYSLSANGTAIPGFTQHGISVPAGSEQDLSNYIEPDGAPVIGMSQALALANQAASSASASEASSAESLAALEEFGAQLTALDYDSLPGIPDLSLKSDVGHTHTSSQITDFVEATQDAIASLLAGASGVSLSYNDAANTLTITGGGDATALGEQIRDTIGVALIGAGLVSVSVNDTLDTITVSMSLQSIADNVSNGSTLDTALSAKIRTVGDPVYAPKADPYFTGRGRMNRVNFGFYDQPGNDLRVPFGAGYQVDGSSAGDNDFVTFLFQAVFTGDWTAAGSGSAPDVGWGFGNNNFVVTGQNSGDGQGGIFWAAIDEFDMRSDATVKQSVGHVGESAFYTPSGTGHIYEMISTKSASPKRKGGATGTADHAYSHYINGINSGPQTSLLGNQALNTGTIAVVTTRDFPSSGTFKVGDPARGVPVQTITYTGKTVTTFTGCTGGNGSVLVDGTPLGVGSGELGSFKAYSQYVDKGRSFFGGAVTIHGEFGQDANRPVLRVRAVASHSGDVFAVLTAVTDARLFHVGADGVAASSNSMAAAEGLSYQTVLGAAGPASESGIKLGSAGDSALYRHATDKQLHYIDQLGADRALLRGARQIAIPGLQTPKSSVGSWSVGQSSVAFLGGYNTNTSAAQNDAITYYDVWLDTGSWQCDLLGLANTDGGIVTAALIGPIGNTPGTINFSGSQDQYAASLTPIRTGLTAVTVPTAGLYTLVLTAATKNASSSAYKIRASGAILTRTA